MSKITINKNKVKLLESDIEDWLINNCEAIRVDGNYVVEWIARQYRVPSGVIDLLGIDNNDNLVVVEIKNETIKSEALAQVCRYAADIQSILVQLNNVSSNVYKIAIGKSECQSNVQYEANALDVLVMRFDVEFSLQIRGPWGWNPEYQDDINNMIDRLSKDEIFAKLKIETSIIEEAKRIIDEQSEDN